MTTKNELPNCITNPLSGSCLITPVSWNSEGKQALYHRWDRDQLVNAMKASFPDGEEIDEPAEIHITYVAYQKFTIDPSDDLWSIDPDGWVIPVS